MIPGKDDDDDDDRDPVQLAVSRNETRLEKVRARARGSHKSTARTAARFKPHAECQATRRPRIGSIARAGTRRRDDSRGIGLASCGAASEARDSN